MLVQSMFQDTFFKAIFLFFFFLFVASKGGKHSRRTESERERESGVVVGIGATTR